MIAFQQGNYYLGVWFVGGRDADWMGCVWREEGATKWVFDARFRYHSPESADPFDDKDKKSFMHWEADTTKKTEEQIAQDVGFIAGLISLRLGAPVEFVDIRGDSDRAQYQLALQPWAHFKRVPK